MTEPTPKEKPDFIEKIADHAGHILIISVAAIIAAWSFYFFQFRGGLSDDTAIWGQFGDFVGGTLNSIFAFFSFVILLSSLRLQLKELRLTREELEATRQELAASSAAQKMQADHFEREARKNDHSQSIEFILGELKERNKVTLKIKRDKNEVGISALKEKFSDNMVNNMIRDDPYTSSFLISIGYFYRIDYHLYCLYIIFKEHPLIFKAEDEYGDCVRNLAKNGWVVAESLKFFGKIEHTLNISASTKLPTPPN